MWGLDGKKKNTLKLTFFFLNDMSLECFQNNESKILPEVLQNKTGTGGDRKSLLSFPSPPGISSNGVFALPPSATCSFSSQHTTTHTWLWSCTTFPYHASIPITGKTQFGMSQRDIKSHHSLRWLQALLPELLGRRMGAQGSLHPPGHQSSPGEHRPGVQQPCVAEELPLA